MAVPAVRAKSYKIITSCQLNAVNIRWDNPIWVIPDDGLESGETEEECVQREMKEETNFNVRILAILFYEPIHWKLVYPV